MNYHNLKMQDINEIMKELWQTTYRGNDIDYIAIKTEMASETSKLRAYNYRVYEHIIHQ